MTSKTLVYKVARFNKESPGKNLQSLLTSALKKREAALDRRQQSDGENHYRLINYNGPYKGLRVGEFFDYTHGQKQPLARFDDGAKELEISSLAPPNNKSDFLHSILYFGVLGNSVILSQSMSLKALQFEDYINWLLDISGMLGEGDFVSLADHPPLGLQNDIVSAKGIEFHAPISLDPVERKGVKGDVKSIAFKPGNIGWDAIRSILPPEIKLPAELTEKDIVLNRSLEVKLMLSWSRVQRDDSTVLLDRISNQLRHIDTELDYTIHTRSGKITQDDFKLRRPISVQVNSEGLVIKSEMWARMKEWLEILIEDEKVIPNI